MGGPRVLIVRHGAGRGRLRRYMHEVFTYLRRARPGLSRHLVLHATGGPPPDWGGIGTVIFWLADPLRELFPPCYHEALDLASEARRRHLRLINPPESLSNSIKSVQARAWQAAGITTPPVARFENFADLLAASQHFEYPVLVRSDERHAQQGIGIYRDRAEMMRAKAARLPFPCAVSPLVDVRTGFCRQSAGAAWAKLYHKKRLIVAGGIVRTKHVFFSSQPIVTAKTFTFARHKRWSWFAPVLSPLDQECVEHDLTYWRQGDEHREQMLRACEVLGLQFAAIDYSSLSDGSFILWEANPHFRLPKLRDMRLPKQRLAAQRVASYYDAVGDFLGSLIEDTSDVVASSTVALRRSA